MNSEKEDHFNGKSRSRWSGDVALSIWLVALLIADNPVKIWLMACLFVYTTGNHSPIKELYISLGVWVHFQFLGIPPDFITIIRHGVIGCIHDFRDADRDSAIDRITFPILLGNKFEAFYFALARTTCTPQHFNLAKPN